LEAAEREAQRRGGDAIGLNVLGGNDPARRLYEPSGYQVTSVQMRKSFASYSGPELLVTADAAHFRSPRV
jgi:ribosomal protein S18 acetylase RimI-like enzyme